MTRVLPSQTPGVKSPGELPRWKPGMGRPPRSPASGWKGRNRGAWRHEPIGRYLRLPGPRRFIGDLVHFAHRIPSAPVSRTIHIAELIEPRSRHGARPSWACVFMKAYAMVGAEH